MTGVIPKVVRNAILKDAENAVDTMHQAHNRGVGTLAEWEVMRVLEKLVMIARAHEKMLEKGE